ncbi:DinB family protein [Halobacillus seohaensis]|uniref:DinB family protein n=1 Tax=Halobacillus seohaensis TaxID=447421 RepID=A0ABW2ELX6_9BACI
MVKYEIDQMDGFSNKIGELIFMLEHTRIITKKEVSSLTIDELDKVDEEDGNSIGALLMHIAAIEKAHQLISFENRDFNTEEWKQWGTAINLGENARKEINNHPVTYYLNLLNEVRQNTLINLKEKSDGWLYKKSVWPNGVSYNQYYLWFHVMEDEINHRGQIRSQIRKIKNS